MKINRMGVYILMAHLLITLAIIGVYAYTLVSGNGDETLKTVLTVIVGYWFGSMGGQAINKNIHEKAERVQEKAKKRVE